MTFFLCGVDDDGSLLCGDDVSYIDYNPATPDPTFTYDAPPHGKNQVALNNPIHHISCNLNNSFSVEKCTIYWNVTRRVFSIDVTRKRNFGVFLETVGNIDC